MIIVYEDKKCERYTDVDVVKYCFEDCEYWVTDEQCREAIADFYADDFIQHNPSYEKKDIYFAYKYLLYEIEFEADSSFYEIIKDYWEDKTDELEVF